MGVSSQHHDPTALHHGGKDPWYPLDRRLGGRQRQSELCGEEKIPVLPGIELLSINL